jgi:hypothetical protein
LREKRGSTTKVGLLDVSINVGQLVDGYYGHPNIEVKSQKHFCVRQKNTLPTCHIFQGRKTRRLITTFTTYSPQTHHEKTTICTRIFAKTPAKTTIHQLQKKSAHEIHRGTFRRRLG